MVFCFSSVYLLCHLDLGKIKPCFGFLNHNNFLITCVNILESLSSFLVFCSLFVDILLIVGFNCKQHWSQSKTTFRSSCYNVDLCFFFVNIF
jgi:hypothetical protein